MLWPSPPKAAMCSLTHAIARRWSSIPKLPWVPLAVRLAIAAPPRNPKMLLLWTGEGGWVGWVGRWGQYISTSPSTRHTTSVRFAEEARDTYRRFAGGGCRQQGSERGAVGDQRGGVLNVQPIIDGDDDHAVVVFCDERVRNIVIGLPAYICGQTRRAGAWLEIN